MPGGKFGSSFTKSHSPGYGCFPAQFSAINRHDDWAETPLLRLPCQRCLSPATVFPVRPPGLPGGLPSSFPVVHPPPPFVAVVVARLGLLLSLAWYSCRFCFAHPPTPACNDQWPCSLIPMKSLVIGQGGGGGKAHAHLAFDNARYQGPGPEDVPLAFRKCTVWDKVRS